MTCGEDKRRDRLTLLKVKWSDIEQQIAVYPEEPG